MTKEHEISGITTALDVLLTEISFRHIRERRGSGLRPLPITPLPESEAAYRVEQLVEDPIGAALRMAIRHLGERLHELGGISLMQEVCAEVAAKDPPNEQHRTTVMDRRWDGIGADDTRAGWRS